LVSLWRLLAKGACCRAKIKGPNSYSSEGLRNGEKAEEIQAPDVKRRGCGACQRMESRSGGERQPKANLTKKLIGGSETSAHNRQSVLALERNPEKKKKKKKKRLGGGKQSLFRKTH